MTQETCWTLVRAAGVGDGEARAEFTRNYLVIIRATLSARWRRSAFKQEIDDAVQDVFVECFREGGAIVRADPLRSGGFRSYLFGVIQNVAARVEQRIVRAMRERPGHELLADRLPADQTGVSHAFDREWARSIMRQAGALQRSRAKEAGAAAELRVRILRLRFEEGLPIRIIAERLEIKTSFAHHEYARARKEFKAALHEVVAFHHAGTAGEIRRECSQLLDLLK